MRIYDIINNDKILPLEDSYDILSLNWDIEYSWIIRLLYISWYLTKKWLWLVPPNKETKYSILTDFINLVYEGNRPLILFFSQTWKILMNWILNWYKEDVNYAFEKIEIAMKDIVHDIDPTAFIIISEVADIFSSNNNE